MTVRQTYVNEGKEPLEALYVFPASTQAAVYGMTMQVGERAIQAEIEERKKARERYEQAKEEGKSASLLEQQRRNVFQMNVANILPGDTIRVKLRYTEHLTPEEGTYEFVYPTVVGPRYSNQPAATAPPKDQWVENPYTHAGEPPSYRFDFTASLAAGLPIQKIASPSHDVDVHFDGETDARVELDPSESDGGNRDLILRYQLTGERITPGLLLHEGDEENFFLMMLQPPERIALDEVPPREYLFVMDVSGSMRGFPLNVSKQLLRDLIEPLRPQDRFNVLLFAAGSKIWKPQSQPVTPRNVQHALSFIDRQRGGGGTELVSALRRALALPRPDEAGTARTVVVATDGYVSFEKDAYETIRAGLDAANLFAFGIGSSVNRYLVEGMACAGQGEPFVATSQAEARQRAERFRRYVERPALTNIRTDVEGFDAYAMEPPHLPDLFAERPLVLFGKYRGEPKGAITVRGQVGDRSFEQTINVEDYRPRSRNAALRQLWARQRIAVLSDYQKLGNAPPEGESVKRQVTDLGLRYNLLTPFTSFVAVDTRVRRDGEKVTTVKQPLPMPQGVPNSAVGGGNVRGARSITRQQLSMDITLDIRSAEQAPPPPSQVPADTFDVFVTVEQMPELLPNRKKAMQKLNECTAYPEKALQAGVEGRVTVWFVVDERGRVTKPRVIGQGLGYGLDKEAIRCAKKLRFAPGEQRGKRVKVQQALPVTFELPERKR